MKGQHSNMRGSSGILMHSIVRRAKIRLKKPEQFARSNSGMPMRYLYEVLKVSLLKSELQNLVKAGK